MPPKQANTWIQANKIWNADTRGKFCVPRKGSNSYNEVKIIQSKLKKK